MRRTDATTSALQQEVHILPLGGEFDRAVLPFLPEKSRPAFLHAHRIHLLVPESGRSKKIALRVEAALRPIAVIEKHAVGARRASGRDGLDFEEVLSLVARLCERELRAGHRVHVNLSSGSKLVAFAAGLAAMAHLRPGLGSLYYVRPLGYPISEQDFEQHGLSKGLLDIQEVPVLPMLLPEPLQLRTLCFLRTQENGASEYRDLVQFLGDIPGSGYVAMPEASRRRVRNWNNAVTTRMVRTVLTPLANQQLIEIRSMGRARSAVLTRRGHFYAALASLAPRDLRSPLHGSARI